MATRDSKAKFPCVNSPWTEVHEGSGDTAAIFAFCSSPIKVSHKFVRLLSGRAWFAEDVPETEAVQGLKFKSIANALEEGSSPLGKFLLVHSERLKA